MESTWADALDDAEHELRCIFITKNRKEKERKGRCESIEEALQENDEEERRLPSR